MTPLLLLEAVGFLVLLACSAFFSSAEVALFSLDPHQIRQIKETDERRGARLETLLAHPTRLLSTILIGNTIINVELWILGAQLLGRFSPIQNEWFFIGVMTMVTLVFGEFGPKRLAWLHREKAAPHYTAPLGAILRVLLPLRLLLEYLTARFSEAFRPRGHILTGEEFHTLVEVSGEHGSLDQHEHEMVGAILRLENLFTGNVMTPRVDIIGIDMTDEAADALEIAKAAKVRYLVLYREQLDDIVGFLDVRGFLLDPEHNLQQATHKAFYAPEQCTLDKLLTQFLSTDRRVAIVVDEYGGTSGLITRGDILEELTGEMDPEDEAPSLVFEELTPDAWLIDGNMSIADVNRFTGLELASENADRLAGWIIEKAERMPRVGEVFEGDGYKAMVRQMRRNRILLVLVERLAEVAA